MPVVLLAINHAIAGSTRSDVLVEIPKAFTGRTIETLVSKHGEDLGLEPDEIIRTWKFISVKPAPEGAVPQWKLDNAGFKPWEPDPPPWREPNDDEYFHWMGKRWATDGAITFWEDGPRPAGWISRRGGYVHPSRIDPAELTKALMGSDPPLRRLVVKVGNRVPTRSHVYIDKSGVEVDIPYQANPFVTTCVMMHGRYSESPVWFVNEETDDTVAVLLPARRTP